MKTTNAKGFSLLELIAVLSIIAILLAMGGMAITNYTRRNAIKEAARSITGDLMEIRTAARLRQNSILVRFNSNRDYLAFVDMNGDEAFDPAVDVTILTRFFSSGLVAVQRDALAAPNWLAFISTGAVDSDVTDIIVRSTPEPNRMYCVRLFPTGVTRAMFTETGTPPCEGAAWLKVW